MYKPKLLKMKDEEDIRVKECDDGLVHGTSVLRESIRPLFNSRRIVVSESYFASVYSCEALRRVGLRFIVVIKMTTKDSPTAELDAAEISVRGERRGWMCKGADRDDMMAYVWMDRNRRFFIASASILEECLSYHNLR